METPTSLLKHRLPQSVSNLLFKTPIAPAQLTKWPAVRSIFQMWKFFKSGAFKASGAANAVLNSLMEREKRCRPLVANQHALARAATVAGMPHLYRMASKLRNQKESRQRYGGNHRVWTNLKQGTNELEAVVEAHRRDIYSSLNDFMEWSKGRATCALESPRSRMIGDHHDSVWWRRLLGELPC